MAEGNKTPRYTTIIHKVRIDLDLSCNEYCVADVIFSLSNNPDSRIQGWCWATRQTIGNFLGITEKTVREIVERLIQKGVVQKDEETKYLKTTSLWYQSVVLERIKMRNLMTEETTVKRNKVLSGVEETSVSRTEETTDNKYNLYKDKDNSKLFEDFWNLYPRKANKKKAFESFKKIKLNDDLYEKIILALKTQKQTEQWKKEDGKFIPHPTTWLNQERWEDELKVDEIQNWDEL